MNTFTLPSSLDGSFIHYIKTHKTENPSLAEIDKELFNIGHAIAWKRDLLIATETQDKIFALLQKNKNLIPEDVFFTVQSNPHTIADIDEILNNKNEYALILAQQIHEAFAAKRDHDNNYNGQSYGKRKHKASA